MARRCGRATPARAVVIGASVVVVTTLTACAGPPTSPIARGNPCLTEDRVDDDGPRPALRDLVASMDAVRDDVDDVPGVSGWWVDEERGVVVFDVASGDDGGAATCTALAEAVGGVGIPHAFEVFAGPVDGTRRTAVGFGEAWTDGDVLLVNAWSCNGEPEVTLLEESADDVRVEITATVPAPGWGEDDCLDTVTVPLDRPIAARTLTDVTSGAVVAVEDRGSG
ncbi:hypothetical protein Q9R32_00330 [Actinotalea sp. AC32]|nr:hypothetical protein [Actinotalea sp. AC32]